MTGGAEMAMAARRDERRRHVVTDGEPPNVSSDRLDHSSPFVSTDHRDGTFGEVSEADVFVRVAEAGVRNLDENFVGPKVSKFELLDRPRSIDFPCNCCACLHGAQEYCLQTAVARLWRGTVNLGAMESFDMIIIGAGSGNSILTPDFADWKVALVERGAFGGTCLNRGCIPSKMFVYAADMAEYARGSSHLGVDAHVDGVRWPDIVDRVFGRIDAIADGGKEWRMGDENPLVTVYAEDARFVGDKELAVGDTTITAPIIVLAAGARPFVPPIPGLENVAYNTSADIMRIPAVPEHVVILGGGFIACEMAHILGGLGARVSLINRSDHLLRKEDEQVSEAFTKAYRDRFDVYTGTSISQVSEDGGRFTVAFTDGDGSQSVTGDRLLVAAGRVPNGSQLDVARTGVELDDSGYVVVDEHQRTTVEGIWALGDICTPYQLKHTANAETRVVAHNLVHADDLQSVDYSGVPSAVFASPQIASFGATEQELREAGTPYITSVKEYGATAYGWAMDDHTSFCKILADPDTRLLLGAHIMGAQASTLIAQLITGYQFDLTVDQLAKGQLWIHPALNEVVENALLEL